MKKIHRVWLLLASMILATGNLTYAQGSNTELKINMEFSFDDSTDSFVKIGDSEFFRLNELNPRAVRNFLRVYKNVPGVKWFKSVDGLLAAHFTNENTRTCVLFDENGYYEYTLRSYTEDKLPAEIRHLVKSNYYDFSIFYISEIERKGTFTYTIGIEDKRSKDNILYKMIRVKNNEIEVLKEHPKKLEREE